MADPAQAALPPAEHDSLVRIARCARLAEHDAAVIEETRQAVRRSRELLEDTEHQLRPTSDG